MPTYKDITFPASDGVQISAWEIIDPKHSKLVVINHPLMCNRAGVEKGLDGVPVNFMPMIKHLFSAGFNVVTYDHRGQGESDGGIQALGNRKGDKDVPSGVGTEEWKDVLGALDYVEKHPMLSKNQLVLMGQCMGATAMMGVWERQPDKVKDVKAFLMVMPPISYNMTARLTSIKMKKNFADAVELAQWDQYRILLADPREGLKKVQCPLLIMQLERDQYTYNPQTKKNDAVQMFNAAASTEKELLLIGPETDNPFGTGKRFEAYDYFNKHPEKMLGFFNKHAA